ncbi:hypothetical protein NFHSH190041_36710 (plasmid) [Shewanella sp. NFH-SH190041]|uniref:DUF6950 family protein n=1 Tax=Shewanella sp. NFH-SH190041 TaxID=2950245 RepID=UPI0021C4C7D1|nr:hypothetical protein [Shewanella sp. NFH-SH190041]BDM66219.1 hypothetical protein NFHSH190041_36710 [Shewanella sp. NFH-SH190041]
MKLTRQENWPTLLGHFFAQNSTRPFSWGEWDCALMAADAVVEMTGHDYAEALRFQYHSSAGALKLIQPYGDLCGLISHLLGQEPLTETLKARRGDVAVIMNDGRQCAGIVWQHGVIATGAGGLVTVPLSAAIAAWEV